MTRDDAQPALRQHYTQILDEEGMTEYINLDHIVSATFCDYRIQGDPTLRRRGDLTMVAGDPVEIFEDGARRLEAMIKARSFGLYDDLRHGD